MPVRPELRAIIDGTQVGNLTFLVNKHGAPYTDNYFVHEFRKWCNEAGLPNCSYHGLRKTCATRLANAGARAHGIAAVTGHKSLGEVARYTKAADQLGLAREAIELERSKMPSVTNIERKCD